MAVRTSSADDARWAEIVHRGVESDELDYKSPMHWGRMNRAARAKIVRHCLALANTKGGYLVIGVGEDAAGRPAVYTGLSREELHSFDPTPVGEFVNRHVEPPIDFTIERPTVRRKRYAIFVIRPFATLPHVCSNSFETELQQGVFYIRTQDASSRAATRAIELHGLIQRALRNQREILGRMLRGLLYENRDASASESQRFQDDIAGARQFFLHRHPPGAGQLRFELTAALPEYDPERFRYAEVRQAAEGALVFYPDGVFLGPGALASGYRTNTAFRMVHKKGEELCQLGRSGLLFYTRLIDAPERRISFRGLTLLLAELVGFLSDFYVNLGLDEQLITLNLTMTGTDKLLLVPDEEAGGRREKRSGENVCHIAEIETGIKRTAADLASGRETHAARLLSDIAERFNAPELNARRLAGQIRRYLEKR